jgi:hypothetical protein
VNITSDSKTTSGDDSTDTNRDPLKVEFFNLERFSESPSDYKVVVWTFTNLWFDDTEAQKNRNRLVSTLSGLLRYFPQ